MQSFKVWSEKWYPIVGAPAFLLAGSFLGNGMRSLLVNLLSPSVLTLEAIIVGFVITSLSILLAAPQASRLGGFNQNRHLAVRLVGMHTSLIFGGILASLASLVVMVVCRRIDSGPKLIAFYVWEVLFGASVLLFVRVVLEVRSLLV